MKKLIPIGSARLITRVSPRPSVPASESATWDANPAYFQIASTARSALTVAASSILARDRARAAPIASPAA